MLVVLLLAACVLLACVVYGWFEAGWLRSACSRCLSAGSRKLWTGSGSGICPTSTSALHCPVATARARRQPRGSRSVAPISSASPETLSPIPVVSRSCAPRGAPRPSVRRARQPRRRGHARSVLARGRAPRPGAGEPAGDESQALAVRGLGVSVVGVDPETYRANRARPHELADNHAALRLLVCHFPGIVNRIPARSFDLILTGHLHAGQICIPLPGRRITLAHPRARFVAGLYGTKAGVMHVSPGTGTTFVLSGSSLGPK